MPFLVRASYMFEDRPFPDRQAISRASSYFSSLGTFLFPLSLFLLRVFLLSALPLVPPLLKCDCTPSDAASFSFKNSSFFFSVNRNRAVPEVHRFCILSPFAPTRSVVSSVLVMSQGGTSPSTTTLCASLRRACADESQIFPPSVSPADRGDFLPKIGFNRYPLSLLTSRIGWHLPPVRSFFPLPQSSGLSAGRVRVEISWAPQLCCC